MLRSMQIFDTLDRVDREKLAVLLAGSYWAADRPQEVVDRSLEGSMCFSAWEDGQMIGFARVITDRATAAWLCDVIVDPDFRGRGVGKALIEAVLDHPELQTVRWMLATKDAQSLYARYGFRNEVPPEMWMTRGFGRNLCPE